MRHPACPLRVRPSVRMRTLHVARNRVINSILKMLYQIPVRQSCDQVRPALTVRRRLGRLASLIVQCLSHATLIQELLETFRIQDGQHINGNVSRLALARLLVQPS